MTKKEQQALDYIAELFETKTAAQLFEEVHRLAKRIKMDSLKEGQLKSVFKSRYTKEE